MDRDPRVDDYIAAMAPPVQAMLQHLREAIAAALPDAAETIKWKVPHYTVAGRNVAGLAGFKAHCSLGIHGDKEHSRYIRIGSMADMPGSHELAAILVEARQRITAPKP